MTSSTSTSSLRLGMAGMALIVAGIVVSGCGVNPQPTGYGYQYEENFMLGCTGIDPDTGEVPNGIFGLVRGSINIAFPRNDGEDYIAHHAGSGFWVGDLALFAKGLRLVSIHAAEPTTMV